MIEGIEIEAVLKPRRYATAAPRSRAETIHKVVQLNADLSNYGSGGQATLTLAAFPQPLGDLGAEMRRGPLLVQVRARVNGVTTPLAYTVANDARYNLGRNTVELSCRDLAAFLQETTIIPHKTIDLSIHDYIVQIAADNGFATDYVATPRGPDDRPIMMGTEIAGHVSFTDRFTPVWGILQRLARDTSHVCFIDETGHLYFGPRWRKDVSGTNAPVVNLAFSYDDRSQSDFLMDPPLTVTHNALRHAAFIQQITSHSTKNGQIHIGTAEYVNGPLAADRAAVPGTVIEAHLTEPTAFRSTTIVQKSPPPIANLPGMYIGLTVPELQFGFGAIEQGPDVSFPLPLASQYVHGLSRDQATLRALGIAQEIQAQEVVIRGAVNGTKLLKVGTPITIAGTNLSVVDGQVFVVVHAEFAYSPDGFVETFVAWKSDELQISGAEGPALGGPGLSYKNTPPLVNPGLFI